MSFPYTLVQSDIEYRRLLLNETFRKYPYFFPNPGQEFTVKTNIGDIQTKIRKGTHIMGKGMKPWFDNNSPKLGAKVTFTFLSPGIYEISL